MKVIHCFGAGLVGSYVATKLSERGHEVHIHDLEPKYESITVNSNIIFHRGDALKTELSDFGHIDIVVNMLPGDIGHSLTTKLALDGRYRLVDLSFSENTPDRNERGSKNSGGRVLWDVGIAPGLSNMMLAEAFRVMGPLKNAEVRVGGNPTDLIGGWNYMAPFSPTDVIAEYTRPARVVRNGEETVLPALSERHGIIVPDRGEMEAFLTDGLRSVLGSIPALEMSEYTVRWPGHIQKFIEHRDSGTLDVDKLLEEWWFNQKTPEFTWMEVVATGLEGESMRWEVCDHGGEDGSSMARTTGLVTIGCIEAWLENPDMLPPGVHAPESLSPEVVRGIIRMMRENGVNIKGPDILI